MDSDRYFENPEDAKFDFVLTKTDLSSCILASVLARSGSKVLHIDVNDFYGSSDGSFSYSQLSGGDLDVKDVSDFTIIHPPAESVQSFLEKMDRQFSIDISVPRVMYCKSQSIDELIRHRVGKYLNFLSVRDINVVNKDNSAWSIPTTRTKIFQDKELRLHEKRALMTLFKSALSDTSIAIVSSAHVGGQAAEDTTIKIDPSMTAIDYLRTELKIQRDEIIYGVIHGVCMHAKPASTLLASEMFDRMSLFIKSLTQYESGFPLLVPMYGNSDIPQAFARTAAVKGGVYILGCAYEKVKTELAQPFVLIDEEMLRVNSQMTRVLHGVACVRNPESESLLTPVSLSVLIPDSFDKEPIYALSLSSCSEGGVSCPSVCPQGYTLTHFIQASATDPDSFNKRMQEYLKTFDVLFAYSWVNNQIGNDVFGLSDHFNTARQVYNQLTGREANDELPVPPEESNAFTDETQ